ncbi:CubicO group peptidase, beta-lactamase class C family [Muriicola jejuensis]|uniref:Beta-lactamase n=1 Tax=Muriicola jejuensis TaxID=504488 RepID=A0A6P0UB35_9FLAO|nr:serine hydrolase domain-containing protein [Muriicola jejuensis]NER10435.1 serine hydrolase [Muriicola jejuensis]SMP00814.1 CubicO group peptidase, beta-lactamase class C family [Muriicola jejuensis]
MRNYLWITFLTLVFHDGYGQMDASVRIGTEKTHLTEKQLQLISDCFDVLPNQAQLSIALIENGNVNYCGFKKEKDAILSIENSGSVFEIGSLSKVFTATLLANFILDKKIGLDDNINKYLNFSLKDNVEISFKQLATHTSGLPRVPISLSSPDLSLENPYKDYGEEELRLYLTEKLQLNNEPGTKSAYSNLGFGLLGYLLEQIDNTSYEDLLRTRIFSKYQMSNSTTIRDQVQEILIKGLNDSGDKVPNWDMATHIGAGGILSNVDNLSKFVLAQFDDKNEELKLTRAKHFKVDDNYSTGLAWGIITMDSGEVWDWHNGGTGGYTSSMILNTRTKNGIIILSNISALGKLTANITGLAPKLMKTIE